MSTINYIPGIYLVTKPHNQIHMPLDGVLHIGSGIYFIWNLLDFLFDPISTVMKYSVRTVKQPYITNIFCFRIEI